jgi:hypothetical protein
MYCVNVGEVAALFLRDSRLQLAGHAIWQGQEATGVWGLARSNFCENNIKRRAHSLFRFKKWNVFSATYAKPVFVAPIRLDPGLNSWQLIWSDAFLLSIFKGRAIAQAVSRRLPTAAARVPTRVWSCGIL